jgi:hypothetical protein
MDTETCAFMQYGIRAPECEVSRNKYFFYLSGFEKCNGICFFEWLWIIERFSSPHSVLEYDLI